MINGDVLLGSVAVALTTMWLVPDDIFTTKDTVAIIILVTMAAYNTVLWVLNRRERIRSRRAALSITANRADTSRRQDRVVDIRVRRRNRAINIPAYKVND